VLGPGGGAPLVGKVGVEGLPVREPQDVDLGRPLHIRPEAPEHDLPAVVGQQREDGVLVGRGPLGVVRPADEDERDQK